jgi:hypothetical protein
VNAYQYGTFDAMTDCAGIDGKAYAFAKVFGGAKHVMTHRSMGGDTGAILNVSMRETANTNGDTADHVRMLWDNTSMKAGQTVTGVRFAESNEESDAKGHRGLVAVLTEPAVEPVVPAAAPAWMDGTTKVTARINALKGGVELSFQVKPAADVITRLKANGWRWSKFARCWWHKRTPHAEALATEMAGTVLGAAGGDLPDPMGVDAAYEDACAAACGR